MASTQTNVAASVLFTLFGGPGLVLVLFPWMWTHFRVPVSESIAQHAAGVAIIAIGLIPLLESIVRFVVVGRGSLVPTVPTEHLVVSGLYRFVRNPMYVGVITAIAGEALLFSSAHLVAYGASVWLIMHFFVVGYEEPRLTKTYPVDYPQYREHVGRWIPRLTPWHRSDPIKTA